MMLMIAKTIDQTFDRASPSVDSDDDALDDPHDADEDRRRRSRAMRCVCCRFTNAMMPAMMNRTPSAMWPTRAQPPFCFDEDAEARVDEAGGDGVDRDDDR